MWAIKQSLSWRFNSANNIAINVRALYGEIAAYHVVTRESGEEMIGRQMAAWRLEGLVVMVKIRWGRIACFAACGLWPT